VFPGPGGLGAAVRDGYSLAVGDGGAPLAVLAAGGGGGQGAGQGGVEGAEAVPGAGPFGQPEQGGQRQGEVSPRGQRRKDRTRRGAGLPPPASPVVLPSPALPLALPAPPSSLVETSPALVSRPPSLA